MRQMVTIPANQRRITGVFKKKFQRRRFNVAIAEYSVCFALMTGRCTSGIQVLVAHKENSTAKTVPQCHHLAWIYHFRFANGCKQYRPGNKVSKKTKRVGVVA
jgi:hypothetical protein